MDSPSLQDSVHSTVEGGHGTFGFLQKRSSCSTSTASSTRPAWGVVVGSRKDEQVLQMIRKCCCSPPPPSKRYTQEPKFTDSVSTPSCSVRYSIPESTNIANILATRRWHGVTSIKMLTSCFSAYRYRYRGALSSDPDQTRQFAMWAVPVAGNMWRCFLFFCCFWPPFDGLQQAIWGRWLYHSIFIAEKVNGNECCVSIRRKLGRPDVMVEESLIKWTCGFI